MLDWLVTLSTPFVLVCINPKCPCQTVLEFKP